jgi:hypothetical protein
MDNNKLISIPDTGYEEILTWTQPLDNSDIVYNQFNSLLCQSLTDFEDKELNYQISKLLKLPTRSFWRIVTSPDFYQRTIEACKGDLPNLIKFLNDSVLVEDFRYGHSDHSSTLGKWSANGDFYFPGPSQDDKWKINELYISPYLENRIPLDFISFHARREMPVEAFRPVQYGEANPFTEDEIIQTCLKVQNAFNKIKKSAPIAAEFILKYAKTIVLRKDMKNIDIFQSSSCNGYIGQIVLLNPHLHHVNEELIAESLVHESIHSLMWRAEILNHIIKDPMLSMETVVSPWSGFELHYYTILQAAFVWYGIANFWKLNLNAGHFDNEKVKFYLSRAKKGFIDRSFLNQVDKHKYNLNDGMYQAFIQLADRAESLLINDKENSVHNNV